MNCFMAFVCLSVTPVLSYSDFNLLLIKDYVSQWEHHVKNYIVISCDKSDGLRLAKAISGDLRLFVSLLEADKPLGIMTNEPATFILQQQCKQWMEVLTEAEELGLFRKPYQWLLLDGYGQNQSTLNESNTSDATVDDVWIFIETLTLLIDSDFKVTTASPEGKVSIVSPYKISSTRGVIKEYLAEWTEKDGFTIFNSNSLAKRRWNLQGLTLSSSVVLANPESFHHLDDLIDKHIDVTSKVSFNVVRHFEVLLNMSLKYKVEPVWGVKLPNGSYTAMIGDLERGEVDIGSSPFFLAEDRLRFIEYYAEVTPAIVKFIFISPPLSHARNMFKLPFDSTVWICCLSLFLIACSFLYMTINVEWFEKEKDDKTRRIAFSEVLLINVGAICQQGTPSQALKPAGRIITIFVYISYMFLYISYTAAIVVIFQSSDTSIQTISDLLKSGIQAGADDVAFSQYYFKNADDELRQKFYKEKIAPKGKPPHFLPPEEGIKKVRNGLYAFHVETSVGYQIIQRTFREDEKCGLQELKMSFFKQSYPWLAMRKHTPYNELLKIGMKRIIEAGFKSRYVRRYYTKKPTCGAKHSRSINIGILDCYFAFLILSYGILISLAIMVAEILTKKHLQKSKKEKHSSESKTNPGLFNFIN